MGIATNHQAPITNPQSPIPNDISINKIKIFNFLNLLI